VNAGDKKSQTLLDICFHSGMLLGLIFDPEDGGDISPKRWSTFNELHGVIFQKIELLSPISVSHSTINNDFIPRNIQFFSLCY
jgi:hypothetical protein